MPTAPRSLDVATAIDNGPFRAYQKLVVAGTATLVVLDGVDNQLLPNALPAMIGEWQLPRAAFANASAAAPLGMMLGGVVGGILGDRIGRRTALLASALWFGALTIAVAFVDGLTALTLIRFLAGVGLGGAMPNATALVAEYAPGRHRPMAITLTIVCVPLGGVLAGLIAGAVVPAWGWRALFIAGGLVPLALAALLVRRLPESPRFLVGRPDRWPELRATLARMGHPVTADTMFPPPASVAGARRGSLAALLAPGLRRDTLALTTAFSCCLLAIYVGFLWIPAMLADPSIGFSQARASAALSLFNLGGVAGALAGAALIQRLGSRVALLGMSGLAVGSALLMAGMRLDPAAAFGLMTMFAVTGGLLNAVQTTMYALAAHVFPTEIRGTGVGATVAVGRTGNVLASYVGSWALSSGGPSLYFSTWAAAMVVVFLALSSIGRHIPSSKGK
jgi:AAHS family 4-hydroxybenzoate transporter-like MFS transporter